ncbi:MAG: tetratricopeptide repeat protein, partial [Candidatus Levybacteria bacterium]|nr:tetratricopeptide repeat protein [Candidatus Levybacteria bacterium]
ELAYSNALIAVELMDEQKATEAAEHTYNALLLSENVVTRHPNNVSFWKNRVRMIYELARLDPQFLQFAIESLEKAVQIAPTDAKLLYNLGYVYRLTGSPQKAVEILEKTIQLKPDYRDAYFTLGLAYHDSAVDKNELIIDPQKQKKAQASLEHILNSISADDEETIKTLKSWNAL